MQGSSGTRAGLVYLLAGAALGAAVVLVLWMVSGGRPFGEIIGTADVSPTTPAAVQPSAPEDRAAAPASTGAQLESEPPAVSRSRELQFKKKAAAKRRPAKAKAANAKKQRAPKPARRKQVVRVVAPPPAVGRRRRSPSRSSRHQRRRPRPRAARPRPGGRRGQAGEAGPDLRGRGRRGLS